MMALSAHFTETTLDSSAAMFAHLVNDLWLLDGGSTDHLSSNRSDFYDFERVTAERYVEGINCKVEGIGSVNVEVTLQSGKKRTIALKKVLYCPDLPNTSRLKPKRLFSQTTAASKGNEFHYTKRGNYITMQDGEKITIRSLGNSKLYVLEMNSIPKTNEFSAAL